MLYPGHHHVLFADTFEFYPWTLDIDFDHMMSITPAIWAIHQVNTFTGQPLAGAPVQQLRAADIDRSLFEELAAHWDHGFGRRRMPAFDRVLFRSLNMANAALPMPAVRGARGDYLRLWSAFHLVDRRLRDPRGRRLGYLDLRYVPAVLPEDQQAREAAQLAAHDYEEPQYDVEQALLLARVRPAPDE